jgi:hypothetical protein
MARSVSAVRTCDGCFLEHFRVPHLCRLENYRLKRIRISSRNFSMTC